MKINRAQRHESTIQSVDGVEFTLSDLHGVVLRSPSGDRSLRVGDHVIVVVEGKKVLHLSNLTNDTHATHPDAHDPGLVAFLGNAVLAAIALAIAYYLVLPNKEMVDGSQTRLAWGLLALVLVIPCIGLFNFWDDRRRARGFAEEFDLGTTGKA